MPDNNPNGSAMPVDIPDAEDLDLRTVCDLLAEWDEEWAREGDRWAYPGEWWHQRVSKLRIRLETRRQMNGFGLIDDDE